MSCPRADSPNKLYHLNLDASPVFDYPPDNLGFMVNIPSILLHDVSQKSGLKSKNVSFSDFLNPLPAFMNQQSFTSNNDKYFMKMRSLSKRSEQFGPILNKNQSSVMPLNEPPVLDKTTPMQNKDSFSFL